MISTLSGSNFAFVMASEDASRADGIIFSVMI